MRASRKLPRTTAPLYEKPLTGNRASSGALSTAEPLLAPRVGVIRKRGRPKALARRPEKPDRERRADGAREEDAESGDDKHEELADTRDDEHDQIEDQHRAAERRDPP